VEQDVLQRLGPDYYDRAIKEAGVVPVLVEIPPLERLKIKKNTAFTFTATVEIKPKFDLRDYRPPNPISLKQDSRSVTEDQVDSALATLREKHSAIEAASDGEALAEGMYAIVTMEGFLDETPIEGTQKSGHLYLVGSKDPILGLQIDEPIMGKHSGDQVEIPQEYPDNHPDERLAGKKAVFRITIDAVKQRILPDLDDEFAKDCGDYTSLDHLRTTITTQFEDLLKKDIEEGYKEQVIDRLLQMHHFDIPEPLIDRELRAMVRQKMLREHRHQHGVDEPEFPLKLQEEAKRLEQELQPEAKRRVKLGLILEAIADKEGITIESEEIEAEIQKLAGAVKLTVEEVRKMVEAGGQNSREEFRERILAEKALQLVYQFSVIQG
jgi:trigger factor